MTFNYKSTSYGNKPTGTKVLAEDVYIETAGNQGNIVLQIALEPVRNHSYADGQVLMSGGFTADTLAAGALQYSVNANQGSPTWQPLNTHPLVANSLYTFRIPMANGSQFNLRQSSGSTVQLKNTTVHHYIEPIR